MSEDEGIDHSDSYGSTNSYDSLASDRSLEEYMQDDEVAPASVESIHNWINAVKAYVQETNASRLDLDYMPITVEVVATLLQFLRGSQVTELLLDHINLSKGLGDSWRMLKETKIKKLTTTGCELPYTDLLELAEVLSDIQISELCTSTDDQMTVDDEKKLISYLLGSRLVKLNLDISTLSEQGMSSFAEGFLSSNLTSLHLCAFRNSGIVASIFTKLPDSQITELDLNSNMVSGYLMSVLSQNLASSKVERLNVSNNSLKDHDLDILAQGLANSNVAVLILGYNKFSGSNDFGRCLKGTKVRVLDLRLNNIIDHRMFALPFFLKGSLVESLDLSYTRINDNLGAEIITSLSGTKVTKLGLSWNSCLMDRTISALAAVLDDTCLEDIDLSQNTLHAETFEVHSERFTKLKSFKISGSYELSIFPCLRFLKGTQNAPLLSICLQNCVFSAQHADLFGEALLNLTCTHFSLHGSTLNGIFDTLVSNLKCTPITHLDLSECKISDNQAQLLAENLKETKILALDLSENLLSSEGARVLAEYFPQSSLICLNLRAYLSIVFYDDIIEHLKECLTGSFITTFNYSSSGCSTSNFLLIDKILLENRVRSYKIVAFFKRVLSEENHSDFNFHPSNVDVNDFMEQCFQFYKQALEKPAIISVLLEEASLSFSREEIVTLLFDKFPRQLVEFIGTRIKVDLPQIVRFLERAEELELVRIVEHLLLLRSLYIIDEAENILHSYVYTLMLKYKQPICDRAVEFLEIERIREYFTVHSNVEGAEAIVDLLSSYLNELKLP